MILIVEDDDHKSSRIEVVLQNVLAESKPSHIIVDNVMSAVRFLVDNTPNKIILDMSLPSHKALPGEGTPLPLPTGGIEVLFELKSKKLVDIPILVLTQYPEIEIEDEAIPVDESADVLMEVYGFSQIDACFYDRENSAGWEETTKRFLEK